MFLFLFFCLTIHPFDVPRSGLCGVTSLAMRPRLPANKLNASYWSVIILINHSAPMMHEHERFGGCQIFSYFSVFITIADCQAKLSTSRADSRSSSGIIILYSNVFSALLVVVLHINLANSRTYRNFLV